MTRRKQPNTAAVIEAFIASRKSGRCAASYEAWLRYTLGKLAAAAPALPDKPEPIEAMLADLHLAEQTKLDIRRALNMLYRWAALRLDVPNPMPAIPKPPRPKTRVLHTLTNAQIDNLLDHANNPRRQPRAHALLLFLIDTGARIGEAHNLNWTHLDGDDQSGYEAVLHGKTGKRIVPLGREAMHAIRAQRTGPNPAVWCTQDNDQLQLRGLQIAVKRALARADIHGGPHMLRHTFGRNYIMAGGDVFSLQRIMGHARITTTRQYVDLDIRDLKRQHAQFSPIARRTTPQQGALWTNNNTG